LARQCLDQNVERPRSGESVSLNHTRMHAYKFAVARPRPTWPPAACWQWLLAPG
jgi:hypothetical protein